MRPKEVTWLLYYPLALQYQHVLLFGSGAWTVPLIERSASDEAKELLAMPAFNDLTGL